MVSILANARDPHSIDLDDHYQQTAPPLPAPISLASSRFSKGHNNYRKEQIEGVRDAPSHFHCLRRAGRAAVASPPALSNAACSPEGSSRAFGCQRVCSIASDSPSRGAERCDAEPRATADRVRQYHRLKEQLRLSIRCSSLQPPIDLGLRSQQHFAASRPTFAPHRLRPHTRSHQVRKAVHRLLGR